MSFIGRIQRCLSLAAAIFFFIAATSSAHETLPIRDDRLENAHRLTDNVLAGAEPHGEAAFQALKDLGVKTIISVDGAKPDVARARKYGLRYVHLPIGYDGVPVERSKELAKALTELDGPIYVHCHHGKHRGPAAAASACVVAGLLSNDEAVAAMKKLGTGENYLGLWESARTAKKLSFDELKKVNVEYRGTSPIPPLAEAMVHSDEMLEHLGDCKQSGWNQPRDHPDLDAAHEALKLREIFAEIIRTEDFKTRPAVFKNGMEQTVKDAVSLEDVLAASVKKRDAARPVKQLDGLYTAIENDCKACHKVFRNAKPLLPTP